MGGPLDGIRVLEVANWVAAPATAALLADMGANVIKVEPPRGDPWRGYHAPEQDSSGPFSGNYAFEVDNRGKRSITLDLKHPQARKVAIKLADACDIFVTNLLPRRRKRFGLDYQDVSSRNPRVVYLSFSGYGDRGPEGDRLGMDFGAFWARSGIMGLMGEPGAPPILQRGGMGDHTASLAMVAGVFAALYERERTGHGQEVYGSLFNVALWVLSTDLQVALLTGRNPSRRPLRTQTPSPITNWYLTRDDKWLILESPNPDPYWARVCAALGQTDLARVPEYSTTEGLLAHCTELIALFDQIFATKTRDQWGLLLNENQVIWAPIQDLTEVIDDPQVKDNGYLADLEHPALGSYRTVNTPIGFGKSEARARGPAPELGQHTEEVLLEFGYSWDDITGLREAGAL